MENYVKIWLPREVHQYCTSISWGHVCLGSGNGQCSYAFPVTNGVKQGYVLVPVLFSMMFSATLTNAFNEDEHSVKVNYCTDDKFLNLKRLQATTKVEGMLVHNYLLEDDYALNVASESKM